MSKVLILGGGGARGAFQVGVYQQLMASGYRPDIVAGISVGALNGSMIATGREHRMIKVWENISPGQVIKKNNMLKSARSFLARKLGVPQLAGSKEPFGYYSNAPLRKLLKANVGSKFISDFYCGTVNMRTLKYKTHKASKMMVPWTYIDPIIASTSIPLVFDPVRLNGSLHVDGGIRHVSPISQILRDTSPTEITIILCNKYKGHKTLDQGPVEDVIDLAQRTLDTALNEIFIKDLRSFERINRLVRQAHEQGHELRKRNGEPYSIYKTRLYEPNESLGSSLNFNADQARRNMAHGRGRTPIEL